MTSVKSTDASTAHGSRRSSPPVRASESRSPNRSFTSGRPRSSSGLKPFGKRSGGEGLDLSREQAAALAGEWYLWFVARYEGDASDPVAYEEALWDIVDAMRDFAPDEVREHPRMYPDWEREPRGSQGDTFGARRHGAHDTIPCEPGYCPDEQRARPASGFCVGQLHSGTAAVAATSEGRLRTGRTPKIISQIRTGYTELMADGAYGEPGAQLEAPR